MREAQMAQAVTVKEPVLRQHNASTRMHRRPPTRERSGLQASLRKKEAIIRELVEDRTRISHDLHDGVLQSIYAIGLGLQTCKLLMEASPEKAADHLEHVTAQLDRTIHEVRGFLKTNLGQAVTSGDDLDTDLISLARSMAETAGVPCRLLIDPQACASLTPERQREVAPILREALSNSLRHGQPRHLAVSMQCENRSVRLIVADDGIGFNTARPPREGFGLRNLTTRAAKLGGRLRVRSRPWHGTQVILDIALPA